MPVNTSGSIRSALGRARGVAVRHLESFGALYDANPELWDDPLVKRIKIMLSLIKKDASKLEELWTRWETYTDRIINVADHDAEAALYEEWRDKEEYRVLEEELDECIATIEVALSPTRSG